MTEIELTDAQRQALQAAPGKPVDVVDPATQRRYVLLDREQYERLLPLPDQAGGPEEDPTAGIPPGILRSMQAFWRDLPELLRTRRNRGRWAAYHGDERVGVAADDVKLIREMVRRGASADEYYLGRIEPQDQAPWEDVEVEGMHPRGLYEFLPES
jgi:hypothetical protein